MASKAFRHKLTSWQKIGLKDSIELREFSDFLRGCQAEMFQIKKEVVKPSDITLPCFSLIQLRSILIR